MIVENCREQVIMRSGANKRQAGFSLIELVIVIVILGIMGAMGADFISQAFLGFSKADSRMEIFEEGKLAMMRMEQEIRNALPNAVLLNAANNDLRFGIIDENAMRSNNLMGSYKEEASDFPRNSITDSDNTTATPQTSWIISIFNDNWTDFNNGQHLYAVNSVTGATMTLDGVVQDPSPKNRYYVVDKTIRYYLWNQTLYRATLSVDSSGISGTFVDGNGYPMAKDVTALKFDYTVNSFNRNALVGVSFTIAKNNEAIDFFKEIHIRNVL